MKKVFKKGYIFSFILGAIVFGSVGTYAAYSVLADNIGYTPKDTTWKKANDEDITNVKDAIDELYSNQYELIDNLISEKEITGDTAAGYWSTDRCTGGAIPVLKDSYYIITVFHEATASINLSGARIINSRINDNHISAHSYPARYTIYYVYTTTDTLNVGSTSEAYLSWSKMRLFE